MKKINITKLRYDIRHRYMRLDVIVIVVALLIAATWAWSAIGVMQRNYTLQKEVDSKTRQKQLLELQTDTLAYQSEYYKSREFLELQARDILGLASPGEHVLILPPNTQAAKTYDERTSKQQIQPSADLKPSNLEQWANFIFGGNSKSLQ